MAQRSDDKDSYSDELLEYWPSTSEDRQERRTTMRPEAPVDASKDDVRGEDNGMRWLPFMPMFPKPLQGLPRRCQSDPIHHAQYSPGDLIEDWPRRTSYPYNKKLNPKVTFSETSSLHIYLPDPLYTRSKSYSSADRKKFAKETLLEVLRIKNLVASVQGSSSESIRHLLEANVVSYEEMLGIEHLILDKSAARMLKERRSHAEALLLEQQRQKCGKNQDPVKLAEISTLKTAKAAKRARIRAALAA